MKNLHLHEIRLTQNFVWSSSFSETLCAFLLLHLLGGQVALKHSHKKDTRKSKYNFFLFFRKYELFCKLLII